MPIYILTYEKVEELKNKKAVLEEEITEVTNKTIQCMYKEDLEKIEIINNL